MENKAQRDEDDISMSGSKENARPVIHTKQSLIQDLRESGVNPRGTLFVYKG